MIKTIKKRNMKKYLLAAIITLISFAEGYGQTVQASIGAGGAANRVRIYLRPDITNAAVSISTLQFNVAIPAGTLPVPTMTIFANNIAGTTWNIEPTYTEGGYIHYNIYNNQSSYTLNCTAGVEFQAMEVEFTGGSQTATPNTAHIVTLPDGGGGNGIALFYCTSAVGGVLNSNGQSLYYARDGNVVFANGDSYRYTPPGQISDRGTFTSFARLATPVALGLGTVPVTFTSFEAKCTERGTIITWSTATEQNSDRFDIQRSENGVDWITIDKVKAAGNSTDARNYQYLDLNGGKAQYRISQVDLDGRSALTAIRQTNCKTGQFDVVLYPVPAKDNLTVVIKSGESVKTELQIIDMAGKTVRRVPAQVNRGNNTINLVVSDLPAGQYMLISSDPTISINKKFNILR
jgi:hypothetical protein